MIDKFFSLLSKYLTQHKEWTHFHSKSIGDIEKETPWREDVWRHEKSGWRISHWQNLKHIPCMSAPTPRHSWRVGKFGYDWNLQFQYGIAEKTRMQKLHEEWMDDDDEK